jgi:hypothetical protein
MQHAPINDPARHRLEKVGVRNAPEEHHHTLPISVTFHVR